MYNGDTHDIQGAELSKLKSKFKLLDIDIDLYIGKSGEVYQQGYRVEDNDEQKITTILIEKPTEVFNLDELALLECKYSSVKIKTLGNRLRHFRLRTTLRDNPIIDLTIDFEECRMFELRNTFSECDCIKSITIENIVSETLQCLVDTFRDCRNLSRVTFENISIQNIDVIRSIFSGCASLREVNFEIFKRSPVKYYRDNFKECYLLSRATIINSQSTLNIWRQYREG